MKPMYKRVLLKLSGEALAGDKGFGINNDVVNEIAVAINPYFSTDTAASLRAAEMEAEVILLAKNVDAVYDKDPKVHADAVKFDELTYLEVLQRELKVMDSTATSLCMDNKIPIHVFELSTDNIIKAVMGEKIGTIVK